MGPGSVHNDRVRAHLRRLLLGLLVLALAGAGVADTTEDELRRYGFSREMARPHQTPPGPEAVPDSQVIPRPRRLRVPDRSPALRPPPPPPGSPPLVLEKVPGRSRRPVGAPLIPAPAPETGEATYVGDTTCLGCHKEKARDPEMGHVALSRHSSSLEAARRGCEGCHGPGSKHFGDPRFIVNPARQEPRVASRTCLECHKMQGLVDPHGWFFSRHASARLSCTTCHRIHGNDRPQLLAAPPDSLCIACHKAVERQLSMRSHHPARREGAVPLRSLSGGKVGCTDCHDPHHERGERGMLRDDQEATCARCHPGFVGPWVFPHVTPREAGGCMACHLPHGGPNRDLLKSRGRSTCIQCHSDRVSHFPAQGCNAVSCHTDVHGSNKHPLFFR